MGNRQVKAAIQCTGLGLLCSYAAMAWSGGTDDCRVLTDDAQRLACYDQLFPRSASPLQAPPEAKVIAPLATLPQAPAHVSENPKSDEAVQQFGLTAAQQSAAAGGTARAKTIEEISATVTALQHEPGGRFLIFLDNGQVWRQSELDSWVPPQTGDRVTIRRGLLGSFMLVTADRLATHVRRVR